MTTRAIQVQRILEETESAVRTSEEVLKRVQARLVRSDVNLRTCGALLVDRKESLVLAWANEGRASRES